MKPISVLIEEFWGTFPDRAEKVVQWTKQTLPHLPRLVAFILLALGAGSIGGMWAARLSLSPEVAPPPRGMKAEASVRPEAELGTLREETSAVSGDIATKTQVNEVATVKNFLPAADSPAANGISPRQQRDDTKRKGYLGIRGKEFRREAVRGVKITTVFPDSPAAQAGLRSEHESGGNSGHIIVGANGQAIRSEADLSRLLALGSPSGVMNFLVTSADGNFYEVVPVTLESASGESPGAGVSTVGKMKGSVQGEAPEQGIEAEVFLAVNKIRGEKGLPRLQENPELQQVARRHSDDMAARRFFGHLNPDGQDVVDRLRGQGIEDFTAVGENIFTGKQVSELTQVAVTEWLKNPNHRKNMLNPRYAAGGVGIARGEQGTVYITQVYLER